MMPIILHNGKILLVGGKIATSTDCCCTSSSSSSATSSSSSTLSSSGTSSIAPLSFIKKSSSISSRSSSSSRTSSSSSSFAEEVLTLSINKTPESIIEDFYRGVSLKDYGLESLYSKFISETENARCGKCAMRRARRKYSQLVSDELKKLGIT